MAGRVGGRAVAGGVGGMGRLTLADVRAGDPEAYRAAATEWAALAADLDAAFERHLAGQQRIDTAGRGEAMTGAARRLVSQGRELSAVVLPTRRIARTLLDHAEEMAALQRHLAALLASAQVNGLTVDVRTGVVTAPLTPPQPVGADLWRVFVDDVRDELAELLARARQLDVATGAAIRSTVPSSDHDAGPEPRLGRAAVAAQFGRSPADVFAWWQTLSPQQQDWTLRDHPDVIGGLDGIPSADRDRANRRYLDQLLARPAPPTGLVAVRDRLAAIDDAYLLLIDGGGDGRVAVALGNPDDARHTALLVPGVGTDLQDVGGEVARASELRRAADRTTIGVDDVSVVAWLGYDPPDSLFDGWVVAPSQQGGAALTHFVDGLRVAHTAGADGSRLTVVGHSYGSTVVAEGARAGGLRVDDIVVVGSPGLHSDHASELNLDPRHVWVGRSASDEIRFAPAPIHGPEPADPRYGANRFTTSTSGHGGYWRPGSDSLLNQAYIVTGQYDRVTLVHGERPA